MITNMPWIILAVPRSFQMSCGSSKILGPHAAERHDAAVPRPPSPRVVRLNVLLMWNKHVVSQKGTL